MPPPQAPEPAPTRSPALATAESLTQHYRDYLNMLNTRAFDTATFGLYVSPDVVHNDRTLGHAGYQGLIAPGTHFEITSVSADVTAAVPTVRANLYITVPEGDQTTVYDEWVSYFFDSAARIERVESEVVRVGAGA